MSLTIRKHIEDSLRLGITQISVANFIDGVELHSSVASMYWVPLNLSLRFGAWAAPNFTDAGIEVVLKFQGEPFSCVVPYNAIGQVSRMDGTTTHFNVRGPLKAMFGEAGKQISIERKAPMADSASSKVQRPQLTLIKGGLFQ